MYKVSTGSKIFKIIINILLAPVWAVCKALSGVFIALEFVTGIRIVKCAAWIATGLVILYGIITGLWGGALILGIPLCFLLALPSISEYASNCFSCLSKKIWSFWKTPASPTYYDMLGDRQQDNLKSGRENY